MPKPPRKPLSDSIADDPHARADLARSEAGRAFAGQALKGRPLYSTLVVDDPAAPTKALSVRIPPALAASLAEVAKDRRSGRAAPYTQAAIVSEALAAWMVAHGYAADDRP